VVLPEPLPAGRLRPVPDPPPVAMRPSGSASDLEAPYNGHLLRTDLICLLISNKFLSYLFFTRVAIK